MKKNKNEKNSKKKFLLLLLLLLTLGLGLGYAALSQTLSINPSVNYGSMKWNVGFTTATNNGGTITASPIVSSDKKSVTIGCDLGTSTSAETCIVKAVVKNDSTFDVTLSTNPTLEFNNTYISSVTATWNGSTDVTGNVKANDIMKAGEEYEIIISISTKELTEALLPSSNMTIPVTFTMNWIEAE